MGRHVEVQLPELSGWFDLWHTHADWRGEGNGHAGVRRESIRALFAAWERIGTLVAVHPGPWQSWLVFDATDSGQDAVYLHTPNPNRDNFPYRFEDVVWSVRHPYWLAEFLRDEMDVGRSEFEGGELYWVRKAVHVEPVAAPGPAT